ncbi:aminotransferase class V-fold PLP-dependent enzyme [Calderihabitans maritimus]|uniref:cysteine desulfurase n=1 Tax=Calderihabitans maritimus TaxID=1246530 RepID=A0A1Z5HW75_9FIRM|nr:aminotransferase class V-fold PLP-dependent enzyme [Calderihabitans maritimus]GAW93658.1 cysteine desulfurase [Calderihabitans maritimus]
MIYLDNAATTWPKPPEVWQAMENALKISANPGRGGHRLALDAGRIVFEAREKLANFFGVKDPNHIVFTSNATEALNLGIKGLLRPGDHAITSSMEHNSVIRPLNELRKKGVEVTVVECDSQGSLDPEDIRKAIRHNTKLIALTHASNVTGTIMPVEEVAKIAREKDIVFLVDAAQTAGSLKINLEETPIDLLAFSGHKGLLGPPGTGGLYIREGVKLEPLITGGTGSQSELDYQPEVLPERFESGTLNTVGIAGLAAGIDFIEKIGLENIRRHEKELLTRLLSELENIPGIKVYGPKDPELQVAVVSLNIEDRDSGEIAFVLDQVFDIGVRSGLHCAPRAHRTIGTFQQGTVRISCSYFNTVEDIEACLNALKEIVTT